MDNEWPRRRVFLHRGMWSMRRNALHMAVGVGWLVLLALFLIFGVRSLWDIQARAIEGLLKFAQVPYKLMNLPALDLSRAFPIHYRPGGPTFIIPVDFKSLEPWIAIIAVIVMVVAGYLLYRHKKVPLPAKILVLFLITLGISTILYTSFVQPVPPKAINRISIDWQYSGAVILFLASMIFVVAVFPVDGPLWVKLAWLFGVVAYGILWNTVRVSVVLSTLYHLGSIPFLLMHYLAGVYIDFIYIVAFYSLALAHLAKHKVSEVGW